LAVKQTSKKAAKPNVKVFIFVVVSAVNVSPENVFVVAIPLDATSVAVAGEPLKKKR
jgi:hypothetical protein